MLELWKGLGLLKQVITVVLLIGSLWGLKACYDHSVIEKHEAKVEAKIEKKQEKGTKAGRDAADDVHDEVENENEQARTAASRSDDPLKSGIDRLRDD